MFCAHSKHFCLSISVSLYKQVESHIPPLPLRRWKERQNQKRKKGKKSVLMLLGNDEGTQGAGVFQRGKEIAFEYFPLKILWRKHLQGLSQCGA